MSRFDFLQKLVSTSSRIAHSALRPHLYLYPNPRSAKIEYQLPFRPLYHTSGCRVSTPQRSTTTKSISSRLASIILCLVTSRIRRCNFLRTDILGLGLVSTVFTSQFGFGRGSVRSNTFEWWWIIYKMMVNNHDRSHQSAINQPTVPSTTYTQATMSLQQSPACHVSSYSTRTRRSPCYHHRF